MRVSSEYQAVVGLLSLCFCARLAPCRSFTVSPNSNVNISPRPQVASIAGSRSRFQSNSRLFSGESGEAEAPARRKKRVRRKKQEPTEDDAAPVMEAVAPEIVEDFIDVPPPKPRVDAPVSFEVQDIRDLVQRDQEPPSQSLASKLTSFMDSSPSPPPPQESFEAPSSSLDESLEMILADAKEIGSPGEIDSISKDSGEAQTTVKQKIGKALSSIVTADFFVVCGFLLWFLLGIFCSYILKDDTVQIAFNSNFQAFVQPALGVLMIGSVAGNFFEEDADTKTEEF